MITPAAEPVEVPAQQRRDRGAEHVGYRFAPLRDIPHCREVYPSDVTFSHALL